MALTIEEILVTPIVQRCSLLFDRATRRGVVIDPGGDAGRIATRIALLDLTIERIVLTHGHLDHAGGATDLKHRLGGVPIIGPHKADAFLLDAIQDDAEALGITGLQRCAPDRWLEDGDVIAVAGTTLLARHCPGHTPGSIVLVSTAEGLAVVGDVLFRDGIGRTDFPYGNREDLLDGIREILMSLPDETQVICGHGPLTTIGRERSLYPYLSEQGSTNSIVQAPPRRA